MPPFATPNETITLGDDHQSLLKRSGEMLMANFITDGSGWQHLNSLVNFIITKTGHLDILCLLTSQEKFTAPCIKLSWKSAKPNSREASRFYYAVTECMEARGTHERTPGGCNPPDSACELLRTNDHSHPVTTAYSVRPWRGPDSSIPKRHLWGIVRMGMRLNTGWYEGVVIELWLYF